MNHQEMQKVISGATADIVEAMKLAGPLRQEKVMELALVGLSLFGEILLDIKRIADGVCQGIDPEHIDALAWFLAMKEAERKGANDVWVTANWAGFKDEAAALLDLRRRSLRGARL